MLDLIYAIRQLETAFGPDVSIQAQRITGVGIEIKVRANRKEWLKPLRYIFTLNEVDLALNQTEKTAPLFQKAIYMMEQYMKEGGNRKQ
jgi:glutathionylspermidine synthase